MPRITNLELWFNKVHEKKHVKITVHVNGNPIPCEDGSEIPPTDTTYEMAFCVIESDHESGRFGLRPDVRVFAGDPEYFLLKLDKERCVWVASHMCTRTKKFQKFVVLLKTFALLEHGEVQTTDTLTLDENVDKSYSTMYNPAVVKGMATDFNMKLMWGMCFCGCSGCQRNEIWDGFHLKEMMLDYNKSHGFEDDSPPVPMTMTQDNPEKKPNSGDMAKELSKQEGKEPVQQESENKTKELPKQEAVATVTSQDSKEPKDSVALQDVKLSPAEDCVIVQFKTSQGIREFFFPGSEAQLRTHVNDVDFHYVLRTTKEDLTGNAVKLLYFPGPEYCPDTTDFFLQF